MHDAEFAAKLRKTMAEEGVSLYGLALHYSQEASIKRESAERSLYKWLDPHDPTSPSLSSRKTLARALRRPPDFFGRKRRRQLETLLAEMHELLAHNREMELVA